MVLGKFGGSSSSNSENQEENMSIPWSVLILVYIDTASAVKSFAFGGSACLDILEFLEDLIRIS
jgi:hypothetical protein